MALPLTTMTNRLAMKRAFLLVLLLQSQTDAFSVTNRGRRNRVSLASSSVNGDGVASQKMAARDSQALFEADVTKVIRELRPWRYDPTVPKYFSTKRLSFTNYWSLKDWERHNSRWRFVRYIRGLPTSRLLRRIMPQLSVLIVWSFFAVALHSRSAAFGRVNVPLSALTLISTFVGALLTLRSNQGLNRLALGRDAMGKSVLLTRDTAMLFAAYIYPKNEILGLKAARLLSLFGWTLKSHIRNSAALDVVRTLLPPSMNASYRYVAHQRKPPVALLNLLRQIMYEMAETGNIGTTEHRLIEQGISGLNDVIMTAEKIRATPIPPVYSAHATRLMMFYLACLPLALLGLNLSNVESVFLTLVVGFAMLGLDEISHIFEQPFRFMPLYQLAKVSMLDVADAFTCRPPPLSADEEDESKQDEEEPPEPNYWTGLDGCIPYYKPVIRRKRWRDLKI